MITIKIKSESGKYPVTIGYNIIHHLPEVFNKKSFPKNVFLIIDSKVKKIYGKTIEDTITPFSDTFLTYTLHVSENGKSLNAASKICKSLLENSFGRDTTIISVGGGITGDIAGFTASIYLRGVPLIHIPTTMISIADSSIGGKTGVNFYKTKNIIGSFYPPKAIISDLSFLSTLKKKEIISGLGEIIKYAFLSDEVFFEYIYSNFDKLRSLDREVCEKVLINCIKIKSGVVRQDEKESNIRKILNLGHTFGHAFEAINNFRISHGEAVNAGIICSLLLAHESGLITESALSKYLSLPLKIHNKSLFNEIDRQLFFIAVSKDKKNNNRKNRFVVPIGIGKTITDFKADNVLINRVLNRFLELT